MSRRAGSECQGKRRWASLHKLLTDHSRDEMERTLLWSAWSDEKATRVNSPSRLLDILLECLMSLDELHEEECVERKYEE